MTTTPAAGSSYPADDKVILRLSRLLKRQVTDRGGDYILTVKGNMPSLERDIAALFPADPAGSGAFPPSPHHH